MTSEETLTPRELEILQLIYEGFTDVEIAKELSISDKTVSTHRKNMLRKLKLKNTVLLIRHAIENELVK